MNLAFGDCGFMQQISFHCIQPFIEMFSQIRMVDVVPEMIELLVRKKKKRKNPAPLPSSGLVIVMWLCPSKVNNLFYESDCRWV